MGKGLIMRIMLTRKWYIILDEAHKGQAELSLKRIIIMKLAENGFIFLIFSATFC